MQEGNQNQSNQNLQVPNVSDVLSPNLPPNNLPSNSPQNSDFLTNNQSFNQPDLNNQKNSMANNNTQNNSELNNTPFMDSTNMGMSNQPVVGQTSKKSKKVLYIVLGIVLFLLISIGGLIAYSFSLPEYKLAFSLLKTAQEKNQPSTYKFSSGSENIYLSVSGNIDKNEVSLDAGIKNFDKFFEEAYKVSSKLPEVRENISKEDYEEIKKFFPSEFSLHYIYLDKYSYLKFDISSDFLRELKKTERDLIAMYSYLEFQDETMANLIADSLIDSDFNKAIFEVLSGKKWLKMKDEDSDIKDEEEQIEKDNDRKTDEKEADLFKPVYEYLEYVFAGKVGKDPKQAKQALNNLNIDSLDGKVKLAVGMLYAKLTNKLPVVINSSRSSSRIYKIYLNKDVFIKTMRDFSTTEEYKSYSEEQKQILNSFFDTIKKIDKQIFEQNPVLSIEVNNNSLLTKADLYAVDSSVFKWLEKEAIKDYSDEDAKMDPEVKKAYINLLVKYVFGFDIEKDSKEFKLLSIEMSDFGNKKAVKAPEQKEVITKAQFEELIDKFIKEDLYSAMGYMDSGYSENTGDLSGSTDSSFNVLGAFSSKETL